ncbi:Acetylaranotin bis-thiomethyltransferase [Penicillium argentinense]|uniref:Acetylaranotin bis-thiomethyltransferase n=1 Tax=Penicillium argentinense TaxID=1131581 RepID=A0A9W9KNZ8_9EURO|nr:Acetylaranotin bis-thiomethyltransferase [Penicillium argentinense]KAJ5112532.1 Acetylaranotin bis-thiomethyltransferase [Penicillium argentinense]
MTHQQNWETIFMDKKFVDNYKTGEHITGEFAQSLLDQSGIKEANGNPKKSLVVLDNACGSGVVSNILNQVLDHQVLANWKLICGDISPGMLEYTRNRMEKEKWQNAEIKTVDSQDTKLPTEYFTHVITAFAYMALPKATAALDDNVRILQPGGTIAFSTWIEPGWVSIIQKAVATISSDLPFPSVAEFLSVLSNGEWNSVSWIESQLKQRGLVNVIVKQETKAIALKVPEFIEMTMMMFPIVSKNFWTEQQRKENTELVRPALAKYVVDLYGKEGEIPMEWTAILSTATKPN